jgi:Protein of unknown function (DUF1579)
MLIKLLFSGLAVVMALNLANSVFGPQDEKDGKRLSQDDMAKLKAAATPGEQHEKAAKLAGTWDQKFVKLGTNITGTGTVKYRPILGGRFVVGETTATMKTGGGGGGSDGDSVQQDLPWEGFQIIGYNNATKQYETAHLDTMSTGIYFSTGTADASGKVFTYEAPMKDALAPQGRPFKVVINCENDDKHVIELWDSRDGKLTKSCEITETRQK